jgi:hypothetical protein
VGDTFYVQEPGAGVPVAIQSADLMSGQVQEALGWWSEIYGVFLP